MDSASPHKLKKGILLCMLVYVYFVYFIHAQIYLRFSSSSAANLHIRTLFDRWCVTESLFIVSLYTRFIG